MKLRSLLSGLIAAAALSTAVQAEPVKLRLHQFLPPMATVPKLILKPWGEEVAAASAGELTIEHYDAMTLGGTPNELLDQVADGVVDLTMTVLGYTPGRFPRSEVFDLPFMMGDPVKTSLAFWDMVDRDWKNNEFSDVVVLGAWLHGPGVIHTSKPVNSLEDLQGMKMRGPSRVINDLLSEVGATPVGMPLPRIPQALSTGVVDGTVIPWEVTPAIKLAELVGHHTEFSASEQALYTTPIVLLMNKDSYEGLSDAQRAAIDSVSGDKISATAARVMWENDAPGRAIAEKNGNSIVQLSEAEIEKFKAKAAPVVERWVASVAEKGIDGNALIAETKQAIADRQ